MVVILMCLEVMPHYMALSYGTRHVKRSRKHRITRHDATVLSFELLLK